MFRNKLIFNSLSSPSFRIYTQSHFRKYPYQLCTASYYNFVLKAIPTSGSRPSGNTHSNTGGRLLFTGSLLVPAALDLWNQRRRNFSQFNFNQSSRHILGNTSKGTLAHITIRGISFNPANLVLGVLRLRYLFLGSLVGAGVYVQQKVESVGKQFDEFRDWLRSATDPVSSKWAPFKERTRQRFGAFRQRAGDAIAAAGKSMQDTSEWATSQISKEQIPSPAPVAPERKPIRAFFSTIDTKVEEERKRVDVLQQEIVKMQGEHSREVEKLKRENRELRQQVLARKQLLGRDAVLSGKRRQMKLSLIDMYSEVLDDLADYDANYNYTDHLPRVVVVGDQSSGKTSVLEMIAQARIFPRGAGEMMTRAPVKVTLSEGPFHVARFKDSPREYDLTKESELGELRRDIELRMKRSVQEGKTVSPEVISLAVQGPGLQRMVLVDLPGVISTVTTDMARDTREVIAQLCRTHMENPNAIILCVQDGSVDAERSVVTDLVASMDPSGKRTIFVLTKLDIAEEQGYNPERVKKILDGKLFPMKALGYFAVIAGKGQKDETIQDIMEYEQHFFEKSKYFKDGVLKIGSTTTRRLSSAVSQRFWNMVRDSIEQQADAVRATRYNLETEWKNRFSYHRELTREEIFEKARGEVLDELVTLSQIDPRDWEKFIRDRLWENISDFVVDQIWLPALAAATQSLPGSRAAKQEEPARSAMSNFSSSNTFNTRIDIGLKQWAEKQLPARCIQVARDTLHDQLAALLSTSRTDRAPGAGNGTSRARSSAENGGDSIYDPVVDAAVNECLRRHEWDNKAMDTLRLLQMQSFEDRVVPDKAQWDAAIRLMETTLQVQLNKTQEKLQKLSASNTGWMTWLTGSRNKDDESAKRAAIINQLGLLVQTSQRHGVTLSNEEVVTVRKNLQTQRIEVEDHLINDTWPLVSRRYALERALRACSECKKSFFHYQKGFLETEMDCSEVALFWRLERMLQTTSNALRQQLINNETRRLERLMRDVLDELGDDHKRLEQLLVGKRVELAESLKRVRQIQEKLEEFIQALRRDG